MANEYWRRRAAEYEREWSERCESELERELARYFRESLAEIEKDIAALYGKYMRDNALSYREARRLIRGAEFREWRMSLREYVEAGRTDSAILKELNTLAMRSRITRLEKLYSETLSELQKLGERSESAVKDFLTTAYRERYYHGIYDLAGAGKLAVPVSKVEPARLEKVLAQRWQGGNYSSRIWKDTERLSKVLKQTITAGLHRGLSVEKMSKAMDREMNAGYKNAERLVRTELNFVQNHAAKESLESAGLNEYEFIAVLDHRTSQRCQNLDGTVHLLEEYDPGTNAPPMHPRCRSTISAVVEGGTRTAKVGGRNIRVPADMSYGDFKKVYVDKTLTLKDWQENKNLPPRLINGTLIQGASEVKLSKVNQIIKDAEDAAFKAQTGADFGFNKLANPDGWDSAIQNANGDGEGIGRKINCQRCVVAAEARMRGYDVIARMSWGDGDPMRVSGNWLRAFEYSTKDMRKCIGENADEIIKSAQEIISSFGEGARAIIMFDWKKIKGEGHVLFARCIKNGAVDISDPQSNILDATYKLKLADLSRVVVLRVDNLKFTDVVKRCCVNKE